MTILYHKSCLLSSPDWTSSWQREATQLAGAVRPLKTTNVRASPDQQILRTRLRTSIICILERYIWILGNYFNRSKHLEQKWSLVIFTSHNCFYFFFCSWQKYVGVVWTAGMRKIRTIYKARSDGVLDVTECRFWAVPFLSLNSPNSRFLEEYIWSRFYFIF